MDQGKPPIINSPACCSISYNLGRFDSYLNYITIFWRNRIVMGFFISIILLSTLIALKGDPSFLQGKSPPFIFFYALAWATFNALLMLIIQAIFGALMVFSKRDRGIFCQHKLEITDEGLVESTDVNRGLHKWPALQRIISGRFYIYIYTGPHRFFQVPRRSVPAQELQDFEKELRSRMAGNVR